MIRREIRKNNFDANRGSGDDLHVVDSDDVISMEILRGSSSYDPELIDSVVVTYADYSVDTITMMRGVSPQVPSTVPDHAYYNNAMITGFKVETITEYSSKTVDCVLVRENGYGKVEKVNLSYS